MPLPQASPRHRVRTAECNSAGTATVMWKYGADLFSQKR